MDKDDMEVIVTKEHKDGERELFKIQRRGHRRISTDWWTRNEAEDLFAQLNDKLKNKG